jgi:hypothetical protein
MLGVDICVTYIVTVRLQTNLIHRDAIGALEVNVCFSLLAG